MADIEFRKFESHLVKSQSWLRDRMKRLLALSTGPASRVYALCSLCLLLTGAAALAQSADMANPPPVQAQPAVKDEAGGGCEPIGLTASGEIVFPFRCKDAIERQRAAMTKPAEPKPAAAQDARQDARQDTAPAPTATAAAKPAAGAVPPAAGAVPPAAGAAKLAAGASKTTVGVANTAAVSAKPAAAAAKMAAVPSAGAATVKPSAKPSAPAVVVAARGLAAGPRGCSLFRSYNAASGSYLAFDGQRHPCREVAGRLPAANTQAGARAARAQVPQQPAPADSNE
jgi:hypothetical protein